MSESNKSRLYFLLTLTIALVLGFVTFVVSAFVIFAVTAEPGNPDTGMLAVVLGPPIGAISVPIYFFVLYNYLKRKKIISK